MTCRCGSNGVTADLLSTELRRSPAAIRDGKKQGRGAHSGRSHWPIAAQPQHQPIAMHHGISDRQPRKALARVGDLDGYAAEILDPQFRLAERRWLHRDDEAQRRRFFKKSRPGHCAHAELTAKDRGLILRPAAILSRLLLWKR